MLILIIAGGPDKGRLYELTESTPIVLGREGDQVKLNDRKVSREHARLWCEGGQWYLEDLGSRHGTYRNHTQLEAGQRAKLKDGDYLQIGSSVMVLGRMPAEHAEKLALLADQQPGPDRSPLHTPALIAGGVAVAALLGLGVYVAIELSALRGQSVPREEFTQLQQQLLDAQRESTDRITGSIDQKAGLDRQLLNQQQQLATALDQTNQAIDRHGNAVADAADAFEGAADPILARLDDVNTIATRQQLAIERLGEMLAHQQANDTGQDLLAAVDEIKTLLADQPTGDAVVARLQDAIAVNAEATGEAVRTALAEYEGATPGPGSGQTDALLAQLLEKLEAVPTRAQVAEEVRLAVAESRAMDEQFMRLVLTELRRTGDQITTDIASAMNEDAGQAQTLMRSVIAELDKRPTGERLAADLRVAIDEVLSGRQTGNDQLPELMQQVLAELERRPTSEQLAMDLRQTIGEDAQRTEALLARVLEELEQRPTAEQIAVELRSVDDQTAQRTAALLESLLAKVDDQQRLSAQIDALREQIESMPGRDDSAVREVLARLEAQERNDTAVLTAIAELRAAMPDDLPGQLDRVLADLDNQVRADQLTDTIERAMQRVAIAQNEQTQATLSAFSERLSSLPTAEELAAVADSQEALAALLDQSDARAAVAELRASLEQLAERLPDGPDEKLSRVLALLEDRAEADLLLAELHDAVAGQSDEVEALRTELLAAIEASPSRAEDDALLRELLSQVETRLATDDSVRQAIRDELQGTILPNQMALNDARDVTTAAGGSNASDAAVSDPTPSRLTRLERAYKQSFETGQPVTVGAGVVDPATGRVSEGRRLDPAVAKALGFETWRDWYLTDRHAEQMRLQQQALRQRNANDARDTGTIELPPVEANPDEARPEQD